MEPSQSQDQNTVASAYLFNNSLLGRVGLRITHHLTIASFIGVSLHTLPFAVT